MTTRLESRHRRRVGQAKSYGTDDQTGAWTSRAYAFSGLIVLLIGALTANLPAQTAATCTWPLTANQNAVIFGNVVATPQTLSNMQVEYRVTDSDSVQRSSPSGTAGTWPGETTENSSRYMQFAVTPDAGNIFIATSISLMLYVNSGSNMRANVYYSTDPLFATKTQIGSTFTLSSSVPTAPNVSATLDLDVEYPDTFYVRIYPWYTTSTTGKYVITNSVAISGTTMPSTCILVSPTALSRFVQEDPASPSTTQIYYLSGMNLIDSVVVFPPPDFEISVVYSSSWIANGDSLCLPVSDGKIVGQTLTIAVHLNGGSSGQYFGTIEHRSTGSSSASVIVSGVLLAIEPTIASTVAVDSVSGKTASLSFTGGNGMRQVVAIRVGTEITWMPEDGKAISGVSANFTEALDQGDGTKLVYDGEGSSVTVTGLTSNTTYTVAVFEYNVATGNTHNYLTTQPGSVTFVTAIAPILSVSPTVLNFGSVLISQEMVKSYSIMGDYLNENDTIVVTAPSGFDLSLSPDKGFASLLQIPYSGQTVDTTIYICFAPTESGVYSGVITHTGSGTLINVTVTGNCIETLPSPMEMIGYATVNAEGYITTTGGTGGIVTTVSALAELLSFASSCENNFSPKILYISGKISSPSGTVITIKHGANISILGVGTTAELEHVGLNIRDYNNVIIRNLKIHEVYYPNDAITIDECHHVWIDHNELYSKIGAGIGVDTYDGLLDIKEGSRYITVSWNYLHHHMKCSLIGHTDDANQQATDSQFRITYHHNWFSYTDGRNPSIRFGAIHMFNNYFEEITDYGIAARNGAHAKLENNHYHNVVLPMSTDKFPTAFPNGYICESGNIFTGVCGSNVISQTGCDFWNSATLPYSYMPDPVELVEAIVKLNAGVMDTTDAVAQRADLVTPTDFLLMQNYPNPFNPTTTIGYQLPATGHLTIRVYDLMGRAVATLYDGVQTAGYYSITFNASHLPGGIYFYRLEIGNFRQTRKMILLK